MGYLYLMMGVIISSAVLPTTLTLMWKKQNQAAAALSPILGLACALIAWLVTAKKQYGDLSVASTGSKCVLSSLYSLLVFLRSTNGPLATLCLRVMW